MSSEPFKELTELDQQLHKEVFYGGIERIRALHAQGADLESTDMLGMTPLMKAISRPQLLEAAKVLLHLGANANTYLRVSPGGTVLHHAVDQNLEEVVNLLLSHGADPCIHNEHGYTPLELARQNGHVNLVRTLEGRVSLFQGWMREKYAPCSFMKRMIWAVVLPYEVQNPTRPRPPKLLLAIYLVSQNMPACKPRAVIELWQSRIEKKLDEEDPCITIFDKETEYQYEILSADEGDKEKLQQFYDACHGIAQAVKTDPTPILDSSPTSSLAPSELQRAISASIQSAIAEGVPNVQPTASTANMDDMGNPASSSLNGSCVICLDAPVEGACVPCGHMAFCMPCLKGIESKNGVCPICRATINQVLRLYPV